MLQIPRETDPPEPHAPWPVAPVPPPPTPAPVLSNPLEVLEKDLFARAANLECLECYFSTNSKGAGGVLAANPTLHPLLPELEKRWSWAT